MDADFEKLRTRFAAEIEGFPAEMQQLHPGGNPESWNVAQVLTHLILTYRGTNRALQERLDKGRTTQARVNASQLPSRWCVLGCGFMPRGRQAPESVRPRNSTRSENGPNILDEMREQLAVMDQLLAKCEEQFGRKPVATHHILGPLRPDQWRKFHLVHGLHHLKQIRRVKAAVSSFSE